VRSRLLVKKDTVKYLIMKNLILIMLTSLLPSFLFASFSHAESSGDKGSSIYQGTVVDLTGEEVSMDQFKGKVALVVNTASKCGFTSQYGGLESLYREYKDQGFVVLGFPSNDFGAQEPGSDEEIAFFCENTFGVTFPTFRKDSVKGENKQSTYKILTKESPKEFQGDPGWNFVKFVVDKEGFVRGRFSSMTKPESKKIRSLIENLMNE
jgi:glutathione peroxidase